MAITKAVPYLFFNGTATRAIETYQQKLGAKLESKMTYGEGSAECPVDDKQRVMHAAIRLGDVPIWLSDPPSAHGYPQGSNVSVVLEFDSNEDLEQKFAALSQGGKVTMAPHDTFWGARFAMFSDEFGIDWMFSCPRRQP